MADVWRAGRGLSPHGCTLRSMLLQFNRDWVRRFWLTLREYHIAKGSRPSMDAMVRRSRRRSKLVCGRLGLSRIWSGPAKLEQL